MLNSLLLLAQDDLDGAAAAAAGIAGTFGFIGLIIGLILIVSSWKIFTKAGKPGWASLIPIYNFIVLLEIVGRPVWWVILLLIPCIGQIVGILVTIELAKVFGKGMGFALGMIFLPIIFFPVLGLGGDKYLGPIQHEA